MYGLVTRYSSEFVLLMVRILNRIGNPKSSLYNPMASLIRIQTVRYGDDSWLYLLTDATYWKQCHFPSHILKTRGEFPTKLNNRQHPRKSSYPLVRRNKGPHRKKEANENRQTRMKPFFFWLEGKRRGRGRGRGCVRISCAVLPITIVRICIRRLITLY
jgi:hypothetical protein